MFAPIDVKANRQLYWRILRINFVLLESPSNLASEAKGSGQSRGRGIFIFPALQQEL